MPTIFSSESTISGVVRNDSDSISSVQKIELTTLIKVKKDSYNFGSFDFYGQISAPTAVSPTATRNGMNGIGITEKLNSFEFIGYLKNPETVILIDDLNTNVVDAQNYVTVVQEVEVEGPYWS